MLYRLERWLSAPNWMRYAVIAVLVIAACLFINSLSLQPVRVLIQEYSTKNQHKSAQIATLRRNVIVLISSTKKGEQPFKDSPARHFSIMELVKHSGGKLLKWQPESKPVTLEVLLAWEKLPAIFVYLSNFSNVALHSFNIEPQGEKLKLIVALEVTDET